MQQVGSIHQVREQIQQARRQGKIIGFVPTMGALHAGHLSLTRAARAECDFVVTSIFVNPTQFGPNEDYQKYPRTIEADTQLLIQEKVDLLFTPEPLEMYSSREKIFIALPELENRLCGLSRPGHFAGVARVVAKLFNIVQPDVAYFGQKDFQQTVVIRNLVQSLCFPVEIRICPTEREPDGLAMSSRNRFLTADERSAATLLFRSLEWAKQACLSTGQVESVRASVIAAFKMQSLFRLDYFDLVSPVDLASRSGVFPKNEITVAVIAAYGSQSNTRLIDNIIIDPMQN